MDIFRLRKIEQALSDLGARVGRDERFDQNPYFRVFLLFNLVTEEEVLVQLAGSSAVFSLLSHRFGIALARAFTMDMFRVVYG
jgi:hypothetical protein